MIRLVRLSSDFRCNTHQEETFKMVSSLCRVYSIHSQNMLIVLTIWFMVNRMSSIAIWWTQSIFTSAVAWRTDICSSSILTLPLLNSVARVHMVDIPGSTSSVVATMPTSIYLERKHFSTRSFYNHDAKLYLFQEVIVFYSFHPKQTGCATSMKWVRECDSKRKMGLFEERLKRRTGVKIKS